MLFRSVLAKKIAFPRNSANVQPTDARADWQTDTPFTEMPDTLRNKNNKKDKEEDEEEDEEEEREKKAKSRNP